MQFPIAAHTPQDTDLTVHRVVLLCDVRSNGFGRHNAFSESHDRAFAMRNQLVSNKSLCGGQWMSKCALSAMERDLKENPLLG